MGTFTVLRLRDPARVAIDLEGFKVRHARSLGHGEIRFGSGASSGRVVLDLEGEQLPEVQAVRSAHGLAMTLVRTSPTAVASKREKIPPVASRHEEAPRSAPLAVAEPARPLASASKVKQLSKTVGAKPSAAREVASVEAPTIEKRRAALKDLRISGDSSGETVVIELPAGASAALPQVTKVGEGRFQLSLDGVPVPSRLQRTLDASAFGGPIATVSAYNVGSGRDHGRVIVSAAPGGSQQLRREGSRMIWSFIPAPPSTAAQASATLASAALAPDSVTVQESSGEAAGFTTAAGEAAATSPRRARYTGRRISMEFKDIDIQNLLRLFAEISHRNIVVSDDVKGKVTIALRNVPWDQAFDLILKTHGLGKEEVGNIIRIAPEAELEKERKQAIEAQRARQQLEPLKVRLIPVNYALAADVADKIKDVLSDRGIVTVDQRTNVLIVKDVVDNLAKAEGMVRNLDTQTPQVLIESRIVEAATTFAREIGIQWGGNGGFSPVTANTTGLVFPSLATVAGGAGDAPNAGTGAVPNFAVNLPAAIGPGSGGGLGFIFGSAGGAFNLNLRLSALENNGVVKTVSAPKVATLDNQEAAISQGLSIPFAQVSAAGVQTAFIEARLELKVTPHVTADGSILMKLSASNNQPNAGITGANGQPSISRKEAKTQMLVKDGDTTVIGGIYTRSTGTSVNEVPFFGKIPILGWLFKHRADSDNRTELLIFITPRILNRQQVVSAGAGG